ncbi:MAG TPA: FAD-dependent oxidoreductase [Cyclobacteriaceae bacterium]|nr:FAD-dependent oxidoreductase [Cyclobacteriaceae bacterium]
MNRRKFLNLSLPATGAVFLAPGMFNMQATAEINRQFSGKADFDEYDLVVNGAGLAGYFAAVHAAKKGKKVLLVDKRTSPGYEISAKRRLWLGAEGAERFRPELADLFLPEDESREMKNSSGRGIRNSQFGDEILLFSGSVRKSLMRNLLVNKVDVLLMTDVWGLLSDEKQVQGLLLASKHGLHMVKTKSFIDASDQVLFSRGVLNAPYELNRAGFILELSKVSDPQKKEIIVPEEIGLHSNKAQLHQGKLSDSQAFLEYQFSPQSQKMEEIEHQARHLAVKLGENLKKLDGSLANAQIQHFALETSIILKDNGLPTANLKGHYLLPNIPEQLNYKYILEIERSAAEMVDKIAYADTTAVPKTILAIGAKLPYSAVTVSEIEDPGLSVPIKNVAFDFSQINNREQCQVLVAGGGTGGAFVAMGAAEKGANTIVVDYFNDLGGTKTLGGVMGYYHGVRDNKFFKKQSDDAERTAFEANMDKNVGRRIYHLENVLDNGGRFLTGAIMSNTLMDGNTVKGVVVCRDGRLEAIEAQITVDATGDGDIAAFGGAPYRMGNARIGETQNYSQWDVPGVAPLPSHTNRDYDIIDNTKISELQRGLFLSHYEAHFYDFRPFLTVRESRQIEGLYVMNLLDAVEQTHFEDVISLASSDFDPHNIGSSEYTKCGFLLPHSNDIVVEIPYRCIVPKTLDGLLISGRGISLTNNAMQFTRMTADILVLGYLTGQIAADLAWNDIRPRDYDVSGIQKEWADLEYLPANYSRKSTWKSWESDAEVKRRVDKLAAGAREYLYECAKLPKEKAEPLLLNHFNRPNLTEAKFSDEGRLLTAKALAWFCNPIGNDLIEEELKAMFAEEMVDGYPEGYVDDYDFIRGREHNVLEHLFWRINQNIGLLAMTGDERRNATINHILQNTVSGGGMVQRSDDYFNGRIDLKIVPFHNRIRNLCFYAERVPDPSFIPAFEKILKDENIGGFQTLKYDKVRWRVFGGLLEMYIAAAMARCGGRKGYELLVDYMEDIHYNFKSFSLKELNSLTGANLGYDPAAWRKLIGNLTYPQPVKKVVKPVEV